MTDLSTSTREKTPGLAVGLSERHGLRTAEVEGAFLLPHLKPGMDLLDIGCGPGSITLGLAAAVAPGRVTGIDLDASRVEEARALAQERGVTNVTFEVGDVMALGFADNTFDAAFEHSVFMHLPDAARAALEVARVLKPGGVFGASDADVSGLIHYPHDLALHKFRELLVAWRGQHGADHEIGKRLRALLHEAGFSDARSSARFEADGRGSDETLQPGISMMKRFVQTSDLSRFAQEQGLGGQKTIDEISEALTSLGTNPGAFWAVPQVQALGWKPTR